jgi:hypothetical protein
MAQISEAAEPELGVLLSQHDEAVKLSRQLIHLSICTRIADREKDALAAERAAEDCIAKVVQLEERLEALL